MKTITTENNNELQVKENWSKPEINLIGINNETLGLVNNAGVDAFGDNS